MPTILSSDVDENSSSSKSLPYSVIGVGIGSMLGAFGLSLGLARRRNPDFSMMTLPGHESPGRLAARALGWGTVLALSGVSGIVLVIGYACGVSNVSPVRFEGFRTH